MKYEWNDEWEYALVSNVHCFRCPCEITGDIYCPIYSAFPIGSIGECVRTVKKHPKEAMDALSDHMQKLHGGDK